MIMKPNIQSHNSYAYKGFIYPMTCLCSCPEVEKNKAIKNVSQNRICSPMFKAVHQAINHGLVIA